MSIAYLIEAVIVITTVAAITFMAKRARRKGQLAF